jgi:hypothetical protein
MDKPWQAPITNRKATGHAELWTIITHPAFRIGFLDAMAGRELAHDRIVDRIKAETPAPALRRMGWDADIFSAYTVESAQYRYEEGRLAVIQVGLRCRAWGHPDYPPAQVRK